MKIKSVLFSVIVFGLLGCSISPMTAPTSPTLPMAVTQITATAVTPTSTPDSLCGKKVKRECAIARNLGIDPDFIGPFSPDMQWAAYGGWRFIKTDGSKEWRFDVAHMSHDIGECSNFFRTDAWSPDSHYVYFSPDPGYCSRLRYESDYGTQVLYRLDVSTGEFIEYLPFSDGVNSTVGRKLDLYSLSFSPDGIYLAYLKTLNAPMIIHIRSLETDKEITYKMPSKYPEAGCLVWSSNSRFLFFYAATTTAYGKSTLSSFYKIDMDNNSIKEIIHSQPYLFCMADDDILSKGDFAFAKRYAHHQMHSKITILIHILRSLRHGRPRLLGRPVRMNLN